MSETAAKPKKAQSNKVANRTLHAKGVGFCKAGEAPTKEFVIAYNKQVDELYDATLSTNIAKPSLDDFLVTEAEWKAEVARREEVEKIKAAAAKK